MPDKLEQGLSEFKQRWSHVKAHGTPRDVTDTFQQTGNRNIRNAIDDGQRVYALGLSGAHGMLEKFALNSHGVLLRTNSRKPIIRRDPAQLVSMLLCSPQSRNMGSDELIVGSEPSIQGIPRTIALSIFSELGLEHGKDGYVVFVRKPQEIKPAIKEFTRRLKGIQQDGAAWNPKIQFGRKRPKADAVSFIIGQIAGQVHPFLRRRMALRYFRNDPELKRKVHQAVRRIPTTAASTRRKAT